MGKQEAWDHAGTGLAGEPGSTRLHGCTHPDAEPSAGMDGHASLFYPSPWFRV